MLPLEHGILFLIRIQLPDRQVTSHVVWNRVRTSDRSNLAFFLQPYQLRHGVLGRRRRILPMRLIKIDPVRLQSLQTLFSFVSTLFRSQIFEDLVLRFVLSASELIALKKLVAFFAPPVETTLRR